MAADGTGARLIGRTLSHFRVLARLGAGGMGVVYRARDVRLERDVALKLLPEDARDPQALERFQREARAASSLNHPNICTVYDVGEHEGEFFIAMELLSGTTLQERITRGPIDLDALLEWAIQICDALEAAHAQGIVHRDVKPGNVFITERGQAKVLDFGLARKLGMPAANSPTLSLDEAPLTRPGTAVGTVAYMSPEQARGQEVDARSDLFSFGAVLYQMATGNAAFAGETVAVIFDAVLNRSPTPPSELTPGVPRELERIVLKCLEKDREHRYPTALELLVDLKGLRRQLLLGSAPQPTATVALPSAPVQGRRSLPIALAAAAAVLGTLALLWVPGLRRAQDPKIVRFAKITSTPERKGCPFSAGNLLYFTQQSSGTTALMQLAVTGGEPLQIPHSLGEIAIMDISRDGTALLVLQDAELAVENPLWILPVPSGSPRRVGDVEAHAAAFFPDGREIVYARGSELVRVKADGSASSKLLTVSGTPDSPVWSTDGRRLRFQQAVTGTNGPWTIWEAGPGGAAARRLFADFDDVRNGAWTSDGRYFLFRADHAGDESLWVVPETTGWLGQGTEKPVLLTTVPLHHVCAVPSRSGSQIFVTAEQSQTQLVRYDAAARQFVPFLGGVSAEGASFSRDGQWVAYISYPEGELWRSKVDGTDKLRLTGAVRALLANWSPDGKRISFVTRQPGAALFAVSAAGGTAEPLPMGGAPTLAHSWSPDGASMVLGEWLTQLPVLRMLDLTTRQVSVLPGSEGLVYPIWSPDGRFIAASGDGTNRQDTWLYDVATHAWSKLPTGLEWNYWAWSHDSRYIFYDSAADAGPRVSVRRLRVKDGKIEDVASLKGIRRVNGAFGRWMGLDPSDAPLMLRDTGEQLVYALDLDAP